MVPNGIIIGLIVLIVVIAIMLPMAMTGTKTNQVPEEFADGSNRDSYIRIGQMRYNKLSDTNNITKPNIFGAITMAQTEAGNRQIANALTTTEMIEDDTSPTGISTRQNIPRYTIPPPSETLATSNKCELLRGRAACGAIGVGEYKNCGVCIKGGTALSHPNEAGTFIGGMLVLPEDREYGEPSVGDCPKGSFFVNADSCRDAANRADCAEAGATGGFDGRTIEGKSVSKCAAVGTESGATYIYDPKNRTVRARIRIATPIGTGITRVIVRNSMEQIVGTGENRNGDGEPIVVSIPSANEGAKFKVAIIQEVPYHHVSDTAKSEVFEYVVNEQGPSAPSYNLEKSAAEQTCRRIGARLATREELATAQTAGAQVCSAGWTAGGVAFPMQTTLGGCGSGPGVQDYNIPKAHSWCYGIKPPSSVKNMAIYSSAFAWFEPLGKASPSQEDMPRQWSQYGDYQPPYRRAVVAQWESVDGKRKADLLPSVLTVDGIGPNSSGVFANMRKFGTLQSSTLIKEPRAASLPAMLADKQWFWSNQGDSQQMVLEVFVPGTFLDPVYAEDNATVSNVAPLITNPETLKRLHVSSCEGQRAGAFNIECLTSIFISEGGDIYRGDLTKDLTKLNRVGGGSEEEIRTYLREFYTVATTGKSSGGMPATRDIINNAAKLMFGFELVSPCEDISIAENGVITLIPKTGAVDTDCLEWLWHNTGNDRDRGNSDLSRRTKIQNTYTLISDRYSGMRSTEGSTAERTAAPFRTCQDTGSMAPKDNKGAPRENAVRTANSRGGVLEIQNFYDSIHRNANYRGGSAGGAADHDVALEQCYGIKRAKDAPPQTCGVLVRYVRILVSGHAPANSVVHSIQIPQLQVFDITGKEVARGQPTSSYSQYPNAAPSNAVNGNAKPHSHYEGEYHDNGSTPRNQYWIVDLGSEMEISKVVYYPRTDCCTDRQLGAPVQLLNASKQIVAAKHLGSVNGPVGRWNSNTPETLMFTRSDSSPPIARSAIIPGARISFKAGISYNRVLRHAGYVFWAHPPDNGPNYSPLQRNDATFIVRAPRTGATGLSFESVNFPNYFIAVAPGNRLAIIRNPDPNTSTFRIENAINGDPASISMMLVGGTGYIATDAYSPDVVGMMPINTSDVWDVQRGTLRIIPALA